MPPSIGLLSTPSSIVFGRDGVEHSSSACIALAAGASELPKEVAMCHISTPLPSMSEMPSDRAVPHIYASMQSHKFVHSTPTRRKTDIMRQGSETSPCSSSGSTLSTKDVEKLLEYRCLKIVESLNKGDVTTPFAMYATPTFTYQHDLANGQVAHLNITQTKAFLKKIMLAANTGGPPQGQAQNVVVDVDEVSGLASVWVTVLNEKPIMGGRRERVAIYTWRREGEEWVWWRQTCANAVPSHPF